MKANNESRLWAYQVTGNMPRRTNPNSVVRRCYACEENDAHRIKCGLGPLNLPAHHANEHYDTYFVDRSPIRSGE